MSSNLSAGLFSVPRVTNGTEATEGYLMLVDVRVSMSNTELGPRAVRVNLPVDCTVELIKPGEERGSYVAPMVRTRFGLNTVEVTLEAGQGALFKLGGAACVRRLVYVRRWWFDPSAISLAHNYPAEESPKSALYDYWGGSAIRYKTAGGLASTASNYIVGGTWTSGPQSSTDTKVIADAGFLVVTTPWSTVNVSDVLGWAGAYGIFVAITAANQTQADIGQAANAYGCHTNLFGFALPYLSGATMNCVESLTPAADKAKALKLAANWQIPVLLDVNTVECATAAAETGLPFVPVRTSVKIVSAEPPATVANRILLLYASLRSEALRRPMTTAVALSPCDTESDSLLRFAAYTSLVAAESKALWWVDMERCAPIGSAKFALVGGINARVGQWGNAFLGADTMPSAVFSTATTVTVNNSSRPGRTSGDLVQAMPDDLVVFELGGPPVAVPGGKKSTRLLYVVSTILSATPGGAPVRDVTLRLRSNVRGTQPIEGNCFEGHCLCNMMRVGNVLPLKLSGGSAQLVGYFLVGDD